MNLYQFGACTHARLQVACGLDAANRKQSHIISAEPTQLLDLVAGLRLSLWVLPGEINVRAAPVAQGHGQRAARRIQAQVAARQARRESAQAGSAVWLSAAPDVHLSDLDNAARHQARPTSFVAARPDEAAGRRPGRSGSTRDSQHAARLRAATCRSRRWSILHPGSNSPPGALRLAGLAAAERAQPLSDCRSH